MAQTPPVVKDGILTYQRDGKSAELVVDSSDWFAWLKAQQFHIVLKSLLVRTKDILCLSTKNPQLQALRHKTQQTTLRMGDQSQQSGFRMAKELVGGMNPSSPSSFAQRIIIPLQYDQAENEKSTLRGGPIFGG